MDPNPYQSPIVPHNPTTSSPALWRFVVVLLLFPIPFVCGTVGLIFGFFFWSHFFWTNERPIGFLSPTGCLLTVVTALLFFGASTVLAIVKGKELLRGKVG